MQNYKEEIPDGQIKIPGLGYEPMERKPAKWALSSS